MELKWLEDYMELAAVRNFSAAAAARGVTQPAFSRRIRALENWIGTELIDRGSYPAKLTGAGETLLEASRDLARDIYRVRDECRQQSRVAFEAVSLSAFHTIALSILPNLLAKIEENSGPFVIRMHTTDFHDCVESLALGRCDVAFSYAHEFGPPVPRTGQFLFKTIGIESFYLVSKPASNGEAVFDIDTGRTTADMPLIAYSSDCFLGKIQAHLLHGLQKSGVSFRTVYENSMSEALKRMILSGKGVGWLPESAARREIERGELRIIGHDSNGVTLDILAIRRLGIASAATERFWENLPEIGFAKDQIPEHAG